MADKQPHAANGASENLRDWPTLVARAVDDVSRILQSEAKMLQTNMGAALERHLADATATLTVIAAMLCGAVCIVCAAILLLHKWMPLWQAFTIAGVAILLIGIAIRAIMRPPAGVKSAES